MLLESENIPECNRSEMARDRDNFGQYQSTLWGYLDNWRDAVALFNNGWQDGVDKLRQELHTFPVSDLAPAAPSVRRRRVFTNEGDDVRIDVAMAGNWDRAFERRAKRKSDTPSVLSIGCGFGGNSDVNHEMMFWTGLQMAVIAELLETAGYRVELRALKANSRVGYSHCQDWTVKHADQPLRMDMAMALFGHAGVYRTVGWAGNKACHLQAQNSGSVMEPVSMRRAFKTLADKSMIAPLSMLVPQAYNRQTAIDNVRQALQIASKQQPE